MLLTLLKMGEEITSTDNMEKKNPIIVAVSGGFDPLHIGHIEYLEKAKQLGDKLVVILNQDHFLIKKKGFAFMPFNERKRILESLKFVDEVIGQIDKDHTVCESLKKLKPNIFAKGGDRNIGNIPEKEVCDELGIKIIDGLGEKIRSSSELVSNTKNK